MLPVQLVYLYIHSFVLPIFTGSKPQVYISADPVNQLYGDKITLTADVMPGLSVGLYQWLKNNKNLSIEKYPAYDGLGTNKLTISPFIHAYEGKYQCAVTFSGDQVVKSNHIELVLGKFSVGTNTLPLEELCSPSSYGSGDRLLHVIKFNNIIRMKIF